MNVNPKIKSYLIIVAYLAIGMLIIGIVQLFKMPSWLNSAFIVLTFFIVTNFITANVFDLKAEIQTFWSIKKIYFLPVGILAGGGIAVSPVLTGLLIGIVNINQLQFDTTFSLTSILITLIIVAWEELWFRGIFLNHCHKNLSVISISIIIGLMFMLVHLLNPEINLLKTGPTLFFAGAFLTIVYFYFKSIWLPIGLHFGNNYFTIQSNLDKHWFFGNEGYFDAIILAILFLLLIKQTLKKS